MSQQGSNSWFNAPFSPKVDEDEVISTLREYVRQNKQTIAHWKGRALEAEAKLVKVQP